MMPDWVAWLVAVLLAIIFVLALVVALMVHHLCWQHTALLEQAGVVAPKQEPETRQAVNAWIEP